MAQSPKPSSTVSFHLAGGPLASHTCATKTSASMTWEHSALTTGNGRTLQLNMVGRGAFSGITSGRDRALGSKRHTDGDTATGTVNPTLALSVTPDAT